MNEENEFKICMLIVIAALFLSLIGYHIFGI